MRNYLPLVLSLALVSSSFAQAPTAKPPELSSPKPKREFGSSLKRYDKEKGSWSPEAPQPQSADSDDEVIRIKTDLVVNDLLVVNQKGDPVLGLEQNDFLVTEDGVAQKISMFSLGENATIPRSIVLIIDYSSSQLAFIKNSIAAAKILVEKLASQDRMAIVTDDVKLLVDFTTDKARLKKELDNLGRKPFKRKFGRSEQFTALVATLNEMFDEEDIRPIVIFQTDGDELFSLKGAPKLPPSPYPWAFGGMLQKNFSLEDVYALVVRSRATVYSITPGFCLLGLSQEEQLAKTETLISEGLQSLYQLSGISRQPTKLPPQRIIRMASFNLQQQLALFEIAKRSGGYAGYIERPDDSESVYTNIFKVINNRYVIGYYPTNKERDGKRRKVTIEVRNYPEYRVMGRKDYSLSN